MKDESASLVSTSKGEVVVLVAVEVLEVLVVVAAEAVAIVVVQCLTCVDLTVVRLYDSINFACDLMNAALDFYQISSWLKMAYTFLKVNALDRIAHYLQFNDCILLSCNQ